MLARAEPDTPPGQGGGAVHPGPGGQGQSCRWTSRSRLLADKSRLAFLPLERYDMDMDLARKLRAESCQRWCVLPFDRMSKSVLVATAIRSTSRRPRIWPGHAQNRLLWYLAPPDDLVRILGKVFR